MGDYIDRKRFDKSVGLQDLGYDQSKMRVSTDRYTSREFQQRERENIWMKTWQVVGRTDELAEPGDWKEHQIFDQSFFVARGQDNEIRGFVNACTHRGNPLCEGKGHSSTFVCPFHRWTFNLDGSLRAVARPDLTGPLNKDELGLVQVSVDTWAGFIFLNPDPNAKPLADYLGKEIMEWLEPYHFEQMIPVGMDVIDELDCNWKAVVDAFQEGYHIQGIHPQMGHVISVDPSEERYNFIGDHHLVVSPFKVIFEGVSLEQQVQAMKERLPATYHGAAQILPHFEEMLTDYYDENGKISLPEGVSLHTLLQKATRKTMILKGMDVSGLTDAQLSDHYGWFIFPNFFLSARAGEGTLVVSVPHPGGDPNKCLWHVTRLAWLPQEQREANRAELVVVEEPGSYPYFEVLQQDYDQGAKVQRGLRNSGLKYITLVQEEAAVAKFHREVDKYVEGKA